MKLIIKAPAKINLSLDVLYKRNDGFHEVEMIMTTIDLADRVELTLLEEDVIVIHSHNRFVPDDQRNGIFEYIPNIYTLHKRGEANFSHNVHRI